MSAGIGVASQSGATPTMLGGMYGWLAGEKPLARAIAGVVAGDAGETIVAAAGDGCEDDGGGGATSSVDGGRSHMITLL